jgi:hypothetical protein
MHPTHAKSLPRRGKCPPRTWLTYQCNTTFLPGYGPPWHDKRLPEHGICPPGHGTCITGHGKIPQVHVCVYIMIFKVSHDKIYVSQDKLKVFMNIGNATHDILKIYVDMVNVIRNMIQVSLDMIHVA